MKLALASLSFSLMLTLNAMGCTEPIYGEPDASGNSGGSRDGGTSSVENNSGMSSGGANAGNTGIEGGAGMSDGNAGTTGDHTTGSNTTGGTKEPLSLNASAIVATGDCVALSVAAALASGTDTFEVTLENEGRGAFFSTDACASGTEITRLIVSRNGVASAFYWKPNLPDGDYAATVSLSASSSVAEGTTKVELRRSAKEIDVGGSHACALLDDGSVWCWGLVRHPVLPSEPVPFSIVGQPSRIAGISGPNVHSLTLGTAHACVLVGDAVRCFGKGSLLGSSGQAGVVVSVKDMDANVTSISASREHTCAVRSGAVYCWGEDGFTADPTLISGLEAQVVEVASGNGHQCARKADGSVVCWGENGYGQLGGGNSSATSALVPVVNLNGPATAIALGQTSSCALVGGQVTCWGFGFSAQPTVQSGLANVDAVSLGGFHQCAVSAGQAHCWGQSGYGQLGDGTRTARASPGVNPEGLPTPTKAVAAGYGFSTCAIARGLIHCWGSNENGELGASSDLRRFLSPTKVASLAGKTPSALSFGPQGASATCAVYDGKTHCWGDNYGGGLGLGNSDRANSTLTPTALPVIGAAQALASHNSATCAMDAQKVYCWGASLSGALVEPTQINLPAGAVPAEICVGYEFACARATGTAKGVYCWGKDDLGQLGDDAPHPSGSASPVLAKGLSDATQIACGVSRACAVLDGGLVCWGETSSVINSTPTAIAALAPSGAHDVIVEVAIADLDVCARTDAGKVFCFRLNATPTEQTLPSTVDKLAGGAATTFCARDANGLVCWGTNTEGQVGSGTATAADQPRPVTRVPSLVPPVSLFATGLTSCAIDAEGTKCWGSNLGRTLGGQASFLETRPVLTRTFAE